MGWPDLLVTGLLFAVALGYATVGLGGGLLYFPLLNGFYPRWAPPTVVALTLLCSVAALAPATHRFFRKGLVKWGPALAVAVPLALCAHWGARFTLGAASHVARGLFAAALLGVGAKMMLDLRTRGDETVGPAFSPMSARRMAMLMVVAGPAGFLSGSVGIGGGVLMVPALTYFGKLPAREAVGTASAVLLVTATAGLVTYLGSHQVEVSAGLGALFVLATFLGGDAGARLARRLNERALRGAFIGLVFLAACWTGADAVGLLPRRVQTACDVEAGSLPTRPRSLTSSLRTER